jgi:hypothetical protein
MFTETFVFLRNTWCSNPEDHTLHPHDFFKRQNKGQKRKLTEKETKERMPLTGVVDPVCVNESAIPELYVVHRKLTANIYCRLESRFDFCSFVCCSMCS